MTNEELWKKIERAIINSTPGRQLLFDVHVVEHCNLNCKSCSHYSPLAEEEYLDINSYKNDCERLSELFHGEMSAIILMGGEPLLHPQITEIMRITRETFPVGQIPLATNGLLLPTMQDDFWDACKKYDITIEPTCYPIKVDYSGLKKIADRKGVKYTLFNVSRNVRQKTQLKAYPIHSDHSPVMDPVESKKNFLGCGYATCVMLKNGKMYPCSQAAYAPHLKKYFNLDMHISEKNGVDIYSVNSGDELLEKVSKPIPFCQYCDVTEEQIRSDWEISKKDRFEWLAFEFTEDDILYLKSKTPVVYVFGAGKWGNKTVALLKNEGIVVKNVLTTRKKKDVNSILGAPVVSLDELIGVESNSICLVALASRDQKTEVYPLLSQIGFGDVIPVFGLQTKVL